MWVNVGNIVVNIVLIIFYGVYFGYDSIQKYLDDGVIIVKRNDKTADIPSPSMFKSQIKSLMIILYIV